MTERTAGEGRRIYDVAVVGLGPAGATLARLLGRSGRFSVCAIDKKTLDGGPPTFRKPCGGLLAPDAQRALSRFDLSLPREILSTPQIFSVRTIDLPTGLERRYQRFYLNLDRHRFDMWLCSLIDSRVDLFGRAAVRAVGRTERGYLLNVSCAGAPISLEARVVVGADGANSTVRGLLDAPPIRQYVSIQQWFSADSQPPVYSAFFDERLTDCYAWSDIKDGRLLLGAALPASGCRARFDKLKETLGPYGFAFGEALRTEACLVSRPATPLEFSTGAGGVFLIGEAAGFVSPSSLEGVSGALDSARLLADALLDGGDPRAAYDRATLGLRIKLSGKLLKCPFMYQPTLRRLVMRSGLTAL